MKRKLDRVIRAKHGGEVLIGQNSADAFSLYAFNRSICSGQFDKDGEAWVKTGVALTRQGAKALMRELERFLAKSDPK